MPPVMRCFRNPDVIQQCSTATFAVQPMSALRHVEFYDCTNGFVQFVSCVVYIAIERVIYSSQLSD